MSTSEGLVFSVNGSASNYTNTDVRIKDNRFTMVMRGNTREGEMPGIGIFEGSIDDLTLEGLSGVASTMRVDRGYVDFYHALKYLKLFYDTGSRIAKLDVKPTISLKNGGFLLDLAFHNSGKSQVAFSSPSEWEGYYNPIAGTSWAIVTGVRDDNLKIHDKEREFNTDWLGSSAMLNREEFRGALLRLQPGETRHAKYMVFPSNPFIKGRYLIGVSIAIQEVVEPQALKGNVEFVGQETYVEFPRDYPSTPEELATFATHQREKNQ
ncbi:hypothetical protein B0G81_2787 [Paraburkholderia sp. BL6665CI2N2]|nr:hypothetical protein B0G81_2787 [Paraburkholderia sp. BL6665CI2N2]